jgi:hypothetical protein
MSVFERCFLFLRSPEGGAHDVAAMKAAGFEAIFCNVGDFHPDAWGPVRERAAREGVVCGPWLRTADSQNRFDPQRLHSLVFIADAWGSPLVVNSESELKGSGSEITQQIADAVRGRDAALSMEPIPFANVDWTPLAEVPVLPQIFPPDQGQMYDVAAVKQLWHGYGVHCVYMTYATYGDMQPADYVLDAPYSLYTADDCGGNFERWRATSYTYQGCVDSGGDMEQIGEQHGITGFCSWLREQESVPERKPNYDESDIDTWPWVDKLERTLTILVRDHDAVTRRAGAETASSAAEA